MNTQELIEEIEDYVAGNIEGIHEPDRMSFTRFLRNIIEQVAQSAREEAYKEIREGLRNVEEIYLGMDGFAPQTAPEAYQQNKLKEMYDEIQKVKQLLNNK